MTIEQEMEIFETDSDLIGHIQFMDNAHESAINFVPNFTNGRMTSITIETQHGNVEEIIKSSVGIEGKMITHTIDIPIDKLRCILTCLGL